LESLNTNNNRENSPVVLVTGATGMLGSRLVYDLIRNGYRVRALLRNRSRLEQFQVNMGYYTPGAESLTRKVTWIETDLSDYPGLFDALDGIEMVFHCAAMVSFSPHQRKQMYETNITGTGNLVNACLEKGVKRICHVSSIAALGRTEDGEWVTEETAWIPEKKHTGYSISKFHSEMEIWRGVYEGLEAVVLNPSVILGPGDWDNGSPVFYKQIHQGMPFFTRGGTGFVDIRDVCKAMLLLSDEQNWGKAKNNRYLISGSNHTYQELFTAIARSIGKKPPRIRATRSMMEAAWRLNGLISLLTRREPLVTRDSVMGACKMTWFDGSKITRLFALEYTPFEESIDYIGAIFRDYLSRIK